MAGERKNPAKQVMARAGNYVAPVDTTGMDPAMKQSLGFGAPAKKASPLDGLLRIFGMGPKVKKN